MLVLKLEVDWGVLSSDPQKEWVPVPGGHHLWSYRPHLCPVAGSPSSLKPTHPQSYGCPKEVVLCWRVFPYPVGVQFSSVAQSCPTLCDPMNRSTPGLPVHHQLPEFTQTHVHWVSDAIQPSHPLSSPSPPVPNPSQHQSLFQWVKTPFLF